MIIRISCNKPSMACATISTCTHLPNAESREEDTKAHGLSVQHKGKYEDDILLPMNAEQITAYLAATNDAKKWKSKLNKQQKKSKRQQASTTSSSDHDSEQPAKRPRVEHYCYCHGTQYSHTSAECKVMQADKNDSRRLCATQLIANLLREAATENLEHHK